MENRQEPSRDSCDSLALARKHVRALTEGGVSREALLRALLEQEEANSSLPPLPSQGAPQAQVKKSSPLSRTLSLSQPKSRSQWSASTNARSREEDDRPPSPSQLSTLSAAHSGTGSGTGSRGSFLSTHTTATTLSSRSSTITQFPGTELPGSRPASASTRAYWCTSCDTEFKRKFDWKRHEDEFHERYKKYPCPDCNRVFWGANTFNQHHKTRHNCKTCPHADKVIKYTRKKRAWACGFCAAFLPSMDRYIDHIGLHYESGRTKAHWYHSNVIYGLLHQPGINAEWKNIIGSRLSHIPKDQQPRYGWDPKTTGRKQGFLENETAGNLQDLLEFFNPTKDDPAQVAQLAFDFAERTPPNQVPANFEGPRKAPLPPPPAPKREKSSSSSSRRKPSGPQKELAPTPAVKERPITQWPAFQPQDLPELPSSKTVGSNNDNNNNNNNDNNSNDNNNNDGDVQMADYDTTAVPPPLFANSMSPPPQQYVHTHHHHHQAPPGIAISPSSDQPTFLTPTTPLSQPPPTPFPGMQSRDTVVDLLSEYMAQDQMHGVEDPNMPDMPDMQQQQHHHHHHMSTPLCQNPPFANYDDWNSLCSTMIDDVNAPRQNGPPLPAAPHEMEHQQHHHHHHHHQQQQQRSDVQQRSDFWGPSGGAEGPESMYVDGVQACDLASLPQHPPPPPSLHESTHHHHDGRSRNVWVTSVDYEGLGYEDEIAPPPPASNWL